MAEWSVSSFKILEVLNEKKDQKLKGIHEFVGSGKKSSFKELRQLTMDEFNKRIDQSEDNFKHGRFHSIEEVLKIVETWGK